MSGRKFASESRHPSARRGGELNQAIVNAVVRTRTHLTGHGPSRAQAFHYGNVVVVLLHEPLGPAERLLDVHGRHGKVLEMRAEVREAMAGAVVRELESLTGCTVLALLGDSHLDPDVSAEVFVLDRQVDGDETSTMFAVERPPSPSLLGSPGHDPAKKVSSDD
jgi:uncharacterized protein YbcI